MRITALRGVCIGVDRHLQAGDTADMDPAMVTFLVGIKAVEVCAAPVAPVAPEPSVAAHDPSAAPLSDDDAQAKSAHKKKEK